MLIQELWEQQEGKFFCISTKSPTGKWTDHFIRRNQIGEKTRELIRNFSDCNLYMCPHGFSSARRVKESSVDPCLLYADLDEANPRSLAIRPTIAIESSPGRYVGYWVTDAPASEELNRRLAYSFGADTSGWDRTQVLRIPGTRNYKYPSAPLVKVLWKDGPVYEVAALEKLIPKSDDKKLIDPSDLAGKIYAKYEDKLPRWARRDLMAKEVPTGRRSEVLWKLNNACIEAGMTREETFNLLWVSAWNKFKDRRGGEDQLRRELDKSIGHKLSGGDPEAEDKPKEWNPLPRSIAEVELENIEWLIPGLFARKELTIVEGDPGLGKSYFVQCISGLICDGKTLELLGKYKPVKGVVAYFDTENTASTITKARLADNGVENTDNYFQGEDGFSVDDPERWAIVMERLEELRPELVVFDTINTYIGGTDTYRSSETQQAMGFFKKIATDFNCTVVILRHLTKGSKDKALYRGQGSIAFTGAARIVATVGRLPDDQDVRVVACTKNNISKPFKSFSYSIESLPDTLKRQDRSRLVWGEQVDVSSDQIITAPSSKDGEEKNNDKANASTWLKQKLEEEGKIDVNTLYRMAETRSISRTMLNRAAENLGVRRDMEGAGKARKSYWSLPSKA